MGNQLIPDRSDGPTNFILESWFNLIAEAIESDLYPRDSSCVPTDISASLGDSSNEWESIFVEADFKSGDIKMHHSYNGACAPGQGWMLCDGRQVTQANYDTEHGAGSWDQFIGTSPLASKYLPNLTNRYPAGASATTQDGISAITPIGDPGHLAPVGHSHRWYHAIADAATTDQSFNISGVAQNLIQAPEGKSHVLAYDSAIAAVAGPANDLYSDKTSDISAQPESIEVQFYMRII